MTTLSSFLKRHLIGFQPNSPRYAMAKCPFHKDNNPSLSITLATGSFRCFSCGARGDLAQLITKVERVPLSAAITKARQLRAEAGHG